MSRHFLLAGFVLACCDASLLAQAVLPTGSSEPALTFPHFPDRVHAFIWRNWNVVETQRMAKVLGTAPENVRETAAAMGLPPEQNIPAEYKSRLYITVIRRNWHLLPYDQLLTLLDISAGELAYRLREDDFLWVKLGGLKPRCEKLAWKAADAETSQRIAQIKAIVQKEIGDQWLKPAPEPPLGFLGDLNRPVADPRRGDADARGNIRFLYSYAAVYGDPLWDEKLDSYPDELLQRLADQGVNGVWLHVVLRQLAPSSQFPEFGAGHERRLENLRKLVDRAGRFGIRVYLYMNEPRAMDEAFFKDRPGMAGVREGQHIAMCTSNPVVRQWLTDSLQFVFTRVPGLGGVFTISASENLTNCASHHNPRGCTRCASRDPAQIIAEVNAAIEAGVHRGSAQARVLVWDWGWKDEWAQRIIAALPKAVSLMSVSEWSLPIVRGGVKTTVGEYSISSVGPGPRATRHWAWARQAGLPCIAKVQVNNTWELSAVPWLPVLDLVAEHCGNLASAGVNGMMLSWSLGGYPSPNLQVAREMSRAPGTSRDAVLDQIARERYGPAGAAHARAAWKRFSDAFREYPFDGGVIYTCPVQAGPSNLLYERPTGYAATMVGLPYDDLRQWRGPYPPEVFAGQFEKLAAGWREGISELEMALQSAPEGRAGEAAKDLLIARAAWLHFRSTANQARYVMARDALAASRTDPQRSGLRKRLREILEDEAATARELFFIARQDSRIGFEATNQYYYLPQDLVEKVINCRHLLSALDEKGI